MQEEAAAPVVVGPGEGKTFSGRGGGYTLVTKATDDETRSAYAFQEMTVAPGFPWVAPHIHHNEDEAIYVLEGECTVRIGERVHTLGAGAFALMPRGIVHTFSNPGTVPARLIVISRAGSRDPLLRGGRGAVQRRADGAARHGTARGSGQEVRHRVRGVSAARVGRRSLTPATHPQITRYSRSFREHPFPETRVP